MSWKRRNIATRPLYLSIVSLAITAVGCCACGVVANTCYCYCWPMFITYRWVLFPFLDDYLSWYAVLYCWHMMAELNADLDYYFDVLMVAMLRDCWFASHQAQNELLDYLLDNTVCVEVRMSAWEIRKRRKRLVLNKTKKIYLYHHNRVNGSKCK